MAFKTLLSDIWNVAPECLRGVPNRTAMVESEGPELLCETGAERKS